MKHLKRKNENLSNSSQPQLIKYCEWKDCNNKGKYKAPKSRKNLREFMWFCLNHIKEYNSNWDYFSGLSQNEIEKEVKDDYTWHLPTWPMGKNFYSINIKDDMEILKNKKKKTYTKKLKNNKIYKALEKLNLRPGVNLIEIKKQYKKLVKKYHPDANLNKSSSNNILIEINEAYNILIDHY